MVTRIHMEALSPTMEEGQVVRWLKGEGDEVANGDVLAEIETDKATMELVARGEGVLRVQLLAAGGTAPVGAVIGIIADADEDITRVVDELGVAAGVSEVAVVAAPAEAADSGEGVGRVKASPLARRLADEAGLALGRLEGSGPGGRIIKRDIEAALERGVPPGAREVAEVGGVADAGARVGVPVPAHEGPDVEVVPVTQMRKAIAKRLVTSTGPVPTFFLTVDVDMTELVEARERINRRLEAQGRKVSINDMLLKATAQALARHPEVNAAWHDDHIRRYRRVHLGVAVAVEDGLITPVVRDAQLKGVAQIGEEVRELAGRARERRLQPEEYTGATFSVSNLGMLGIEEFTAIINPPEAGIIAVGQVEQRPVVDDAGELIVRQRMKLTMSCDHRVIDGATGARFLQTLRSFIEEPAMMVV